MNTVVPLPVKPRPPRHRPLVCQGVYGRPGGHGLDSLARLLLAIAADAVESGKDDDRPGFQTLLRAYRAAGRGGRISARLIERAVLDRLFADLAAPDIAQEIAARMRQSAAPTGRPRDLAALRRRMATLEGKITRLVDLIAEAGEAAPAYRRAIASAEQERAALATEIEQAETDSRQATIIRAWTVADVTRLLATLRASLETDLAEERVLAAREAIAGLVEKIVLDLESRTWEIHYKLYTGVKLASPRGSHDAPVTLVRRGPLPERRAA